MNRSGAARPAGTILLALFLGVGVAAFSPASLDGREPVSRLDDGAGPAAGAPPLIYLTFDDGPHPVYTPMVLEVLAAHGAKATFFVVGSMVQNWPETTRLIAEAGHSIQLHTWMHDNLTRFTREEFAADTRLTQAILEEVAERRATCLRPPYGAVNARVAGWAAEHDLQVVMWDVAAADWTDISAGRMARTVLNRVGPGAVVLLHDGGGRRDRTVAALDVILTELTAEGYRFRPMCSALPVTEPVRPCWTFYAWPEARRCAEDSRLPET